MATSAHRLGKMGIGGKAHRGILLVARHTSPSLVAAGLSVEFGATLTGVHGSRACFSRIRAHAGCFPTMCGRERPQLWPRTRRFQAKCWRCHSKIGRPTLVELGSYLVNSGPKLRKSCQSQPGRGESSLDLLATKSLFHAYAGITSHVQQLSSMKPISPQTHQRTTGVWGRGHAHRADAESVIATPARSSLNAVQPNNCKGRSVSPQRVHVCNESEVGGVSLLWIPQPGSCVLCSCHA